MQSEYPQYIRHQDGRPDKLVHNEDELREAVEIDGFSEPAPMGVGSGPGIPSNYIAQEYPKYVRNAAGESMQVIDDADEAAAAIKGFVDPDKVAAAKLPPPLANGPKTGKKVAANEPVVAPDPVVPAPVASDANENKALADELSSLLGGEAPATMNDEGLPPPVEVPSDELPATPGRPTPSAAAVKRAQAAAAEEAKAKKKADAKAAREAAK